MVPAGTESLLQYRNHLEACYCIAGHGEVEDVDGNVYPIRPGDMYALDNSPLRGTERHTLDGASGSTH
ncbi:MULTISPECIES: ectoine synthase [Burkholderia]|uniref:ectoine synthase n=1 Tax=Burkholderia TaxID=32008 RepID=UPI0009307D1C|nr:MULTISPECIES: ectoine synthase [Burkholderia]